ncbi:MAG TPA: autotransporter outer membrane beta-barrel domain-containing protein [Caulobacteraceae bacterium]|nr:autotransporter outer membrane beta-barrel domain-containing protein [Caulobacteraceae bacterium]
MRKMLATAVALAPLCVASGAYAEVVISNERTTPVATATAGPGNTSDDVKIAAGGSVKVTTGAAVTLNSSENVTNQGTILMENAANGATGILVVGGNTGNVENTSVITVSDSLTSYTDADSDGDPDGPLAAGQDRYGIRVTGPGAHTGNITNAKTGAITVEGNDSYGLSVETNVTGNVTNRGSIRVTGGRVAPSGGTYAIRVTGDVTGDVTIGGGVFATGEGATAVALDGDVSGKVIIDGTVSSTGFRNNQRLPDPAARAKLDSDDLLNAGPAVRLSGSYAQGVLFDSAQLDAISTDDDEDDDGILDKDETTANITVFGSSPAVLIGSETQATSLGLVGTGVNAYGLILKGTIASSGVNDGFNSTSIQLGTSAGQTLQINGGIRLVGSVSSNSWEADAVAMRLYGGVTTPRILVEGNLLAGGTSEADKDAVALLVGAGASAPDLNISGAVRAAVAGEKGDAVAVRDLSGSITTVLNTGQVSAVLVATDDANDADDTNTDASDEVVTGKGIAFDLQANTTGVTFTQNGLTDGDDNSDGQPDADADGDGVDDNNEPAITGAILLGSGADNVNILNGTVTGDIAFGAGADTLVVNGGGALVRGALFDSDGQLAVNLVKGTLENGFRANDATANPNDYIASRINISSLNVGADGDLVVTLDPASGQTSGFNVSGTATFADGAGLGVRFTDLLTAPTQFTVVQAGTLNVDVTKLDLAALAGNTPFLFVATPGADLANNRLYVDVARRTAAQAGMSQAQAAAFDPFYSALATDQQIRNAFLAQVTSEEFFALYEQILPEHSGAPLLSLAAGTDAVTRALSDRRPTSEAGETTAWLQEINFQAEKDRTESEGFTSEGFGIAGGIERGGPLGALGVSLAFTSSDLEDPSSVGDENLTARLLELGVYWRATGEHWRTWARAAGGYASFDSVRQFSADTVVRRNESDWSGWSVAAGAGASYEVAIGRWFARPEITADYFRLSEDAHEETGGGAGFDLSIDEREGQILVASAMLNVGGRFGESWWFAPELRVGYRQYLSSDAGETIARFRNAGGTPGDAFTLVPGEIDGGGLVVGFRLMSGGSMGFFAVEGDAQMLDDYVRYSLLLRASFRF